MGNQTTGWLPFGSNDPSVVFQHSLTVPPNNDNGLWAQLWAGNGTDGWGTVGSLTESQTPTHDAVKGMRAIASDGTPAGYRFRESIDTGSPQTRDWDNVGQLTIEVETDLVDTYDATYNPNAYIPNGNGDGILSSSLGSYIEKILSGVILIMATPNGSAQVNYNNFEKAGINNGIPRYFKVGKPNTVIINIAWMGRFYIAAVDGFIVGYFEDSNETVDRFNNLYIGSDRGQRTDHCENKWIKNLQISTAFPNFSLSGKIPHVAALSDSIFDDTGTADAGSGGDNSPRFQIDKSFHKKGMRTNITVSENGGYAVDSAQSPASLHDVLDSGFLKYDMHTVILQGGANDAGGVFATSEAVFEFEYKRLVNRIMGAGGEPSTSVINIICCTPASRFVTEGNQANEDRIIAFGDIIKALTFWWDSANPTRAGALKVVDIFKAFGGSGNPLPLVFKGQVLGSGDIHYAPAGNLIYGQEIVKAIWDF